MQMLGIASSPQVDTVDEIHDTFQECVEDILRMIWTISVQRSASCKPFDITTQFAPLQGRTLYLPLETRRDLIALKIP